MVPYVKSKTIALAWYKEDVWDEENFAEPLMISLQTTSTKNVLSVQLRPYAVACLRDSSK